MHTQILKWKKNNNNTLLLFVYTYDFKSVPSCPQLNDHPTKILRNTQMRS